MSKKQKCIVMMGIPASGKSTIAQRLKSTMENVVLLSSDKMREELFGNRKDNEHNSELFEELHRRAKQALKEGKNVIYDATNVNSKRRMGFLKQLPKGVEKELYYVCVGVNQAITQDMKREYCVGEEVINRMYKTLQVPYSHEKWDKITVDLVFSSAKGVSSNGEFFRSKIKEMCERLFTYEEFVVLLRNGLGIFDCMIGLPQDNPFHTFTVDKHTYYVYEHIFKYYEKEDREDLILASIFHDVGKPFCKTYEEGLRYARYYGHDNVGGQMTLRGLLLLGYSQERALKIASLVGLHMRLSFQLDIQADNKLEKLVGHDTFIKLNYLRQADIQAK